jgi:hypothetical protein
MEKVDESYQKDLPIVSHGRGSLNLNPNIIRDLYPNKL